MRPMMIAVPNALMTAKALMPSFGERLRLSAEAISEDRAAIILSLYSPIAPQRLGRQGRADNQQMSAPEQKCHRG